MRKKKKLLVYLMSLALLISVMCIYWPGAWAEAAARPVMNYKTVSVQAGRTAKLELSGAKGKVTWKSLDKQIATVSKTGKVKAKKAGTVTVTAKNKGKSYKCTVTVGEKETKTLIAYFSLTGTTRDAAKKVHAAAGGDFLRIQPKTAYQTDYDKMLAVAKKEYNRKTNPVRATKVFNMDQYDRVFIGYPIWLGDAPRLVQAFLKDYDFSGKTVIPFCTSGATGISGSMDSIRKAAVGATVLDGRDLPDDSKKQVAQWVDGLSGKTGQAGNSESDADKAGTGRTGTADGTTGTGNADGTAVTEQTGSADGTAGMTQPEITDGVETTGQQDTGTDAQTEPGKAQKYLIAYFSAQAGNTKAAVGQIARVLGTGAELYEVAPAIPYAESDLLPYYDEDTRAYKEAHGTLPNPGLAAGSFDPAGYDVVFLGYPIWYGKAAPIMDTFLRTYQDELSGKTIIPFFTSAATSTDTHLQESFPDLDIRIGHRAMGESDIRNWLSGLGYGQ